MKNDLGDLTSRLDNLDLEVKKFTASIQQMEEAISNQKQANQEKEDGFKVKKRTLDLLPDAENNIAKLQVNDIPYYFVIKQRFFPFQHNPKNLDPS